MTVHHLKGLRAQPLASYLAAVGVLRLLHDQRDPDARGQWSDGAFTLHTALTQEQLLHFFQHEYVPTPITSPWNGGSGYYEQNLALDAIASSDDPRFKRFRDTIAQIKSILTRLKIEDKPEGEAKTHLLRTLKAELKETEWLDAVVKLEEKPHFRPLLGTGGNDGRMEFSANQARRLHQLLLSSSGELLQAALFDTLTHHLQPLPIGMFAPGWAGGVNLDNGFDADAHLNPWLYVLMMEGALVAAHHPTVPHLPIGHGKLARDEQGRREIWLPLWNQSLSYPEVQQLFRQSRASSPIDRAIAGADHTSARYALLNRNGHAHFAVHLGEHRAQAPVTASMFKSLDQWCRPVRELERAKSLQRALRRYEDTVMHHLQGHRSLTEVLERLGELHLQLHQTPDVPPLPRLSPSWVGHADDKTVEFRLAVALCSLGQRETANLREQLNSRAVDLPGRLLSLLGQRIKVGHREGEAHPNLGQSSVALADIEAYIRGQTDDARLERLLYALCLFPPAAHGLSIGHPTDLLPLPYLLAKLAFHRAPSDSRTPPSRVLPLLVKGRGREAMQESRRFLLGRGLAVPSPPPCSLDAATGRRIASALLFPISPRTYDEIAARFNNERDAHV